MMGPLRYRDPSSGLQYVLSRCPWCITCSGRLATSFLAHSFLYRMQNATVWPLVAHPSQELLKAGSEITKDMSVGSCKTSLKGGF